MKVTGVVLLLGGVLASSMSAQQPGAGSAPASAGNRQVRRILQPPKSAMAQGVAARSTAQTMAAHTDPPLEHLPAFSVTGMDGKTAGVGTLHPAGHWLLLYRSEHCTGCDKAMAALARSASPLFKQGSPFVIVVKSGGAKSTPDMLDHLKGTYPTLSNAAWVEDVNGEGFKALKPHGEPALYALSGTDVAWTVHGTLSNPAMLERQASTWLASTSKPQGKGGSSLAAKSIPTEAAASMAGTNSVTPPSH